MSNVELSRSQRLDQYVQTQLPDFSRAFAAKLIADGKVTVNGMVQTKSGAKPRTGDIIMIDYDAEDAQDVPVITIPILYEDKDCVVINKPAGVLTHSKGAFNPEGTVASWLRQHLQADYAALDTDVNARAGIVHRLDRATSGVLIGAKHAEALSWLQKQFSQRRVKKSYRAIVAGHLEHPQALIDLPINRNPKAPSSFRVDANGKHARTTYQVLQETPNYSEIEFTPETGRTHQLRVHASHIGHTIVGDTLYRGVKADRMFLHAHKLELTLPSRERAVFEAPVPAEFTDFLQQDRDA